MPRVTDVYSLPSELVLGGRLNARVQEVDQKRQRSETEEILTRFRRQPGVVLADEVGMGKTFVALAVAYTVATQSPLGPVIVMAPANLLDKWRQDLTTFCELYLDGRRAVARELATRKDVKDRSVVLHGVARDGIDLMKLLDDPARERCHFIFLALGAMGRRQTDKWVRLALVAEALSRHARGRASRLIQVKQQIHRFMGELLWAIGEERAHGWGEGLWERLLRTSPEAWKETYNSEIRNETNRLNDDPVPKAVIRAIRRLDDLKPLAEALEQMPVRAKGGDERVSERLDTARRALRVVEQGLWKELLAKATWRSPLLVMDEAHHLKNPGTSLARQLQTADLEIDADLRTGDGAMANAFDRMLFLTATPFQLGHRELVHVLKRFGDVRWGAGQKEERERFKTQLDDLARRLDDSQRAAIALRRAWGLLRPEDVPVDIDVEAWWAGMLRAEPESLTHHQRAAREAFEKARACRDSAEEALRPWIVRHNKRSHWAGTEIRRRHRLDGAAIAGAEGSAGLAIPQAQLLAFFLAARAAVRPTDDLLGEALSSSYEAFRLTRRNREAVAKDEQDEAETAAQDLSRAEWYLTEFDHALKQPDGSTHPKVQATVRKVVDLWESGEKVLVFAYYRRTCAALRLHISREIEARIVSVAQARLLQAGREASHEEVETLVEQAQKRYFDDSRAPGRRALDKALDEIVAAHEKALATAEIAGSMVEDVKDVMRRFLRVPTTLARCFPLGQVRSLAPAEVVAAMLGERDASGISWRDKFDGFIRYLTRECSPGERGPCLEAAKKTQTGEIRVRVGDEDTGEGSAEHKGTLANIQVATGETRRETRARLMRAFNTPFFPDVLVCSEVMGEGVDLQRFCRHVIHHDLAWNPSTLEQRTGRIDRLACKAEGRQSIVVFVPYLAGTADERQYQVMSEREQWFRVVMGQDEVAKLITPDSTNVVALPTAVAERLSFNLSVVPS